MNKINWARISHITQSLVFIAVLFYFSLQVLIYFKDILTIFISAGLLAFLSNEMVRPLSKIKIPRGVSIILVHVLAFIVLGVTIALIIPPVIQQAGSLINSIPDYATKVQEWVKGGESKFLSMGIPIQLEQTITSFLDGFKNFILNFSSGFPQLLIDSFSVFINVIMILVISIYLLLDFDKLWQKFLNIFQPKPRKKMDYLKREMTRSLRGFLIGQVFGSLITIAVLIIVYPLLGLNFGIIAAVVYGVITLIPYFGPYIGILPVAFLAVLQGPWMFLWILVITMVFEQFKNTVVLPKLMSESIGIHPLGIFIAILVGLKVGGFLGLVLGIPIAGVLEAVFRVVFHYDDKADGTEEKKQDGKTDEKKELPPPQPSET